MQILKYGRALQTTANQSNRDLLKRMSPTEAVVNKFATFTEGLLNKWVQLKQVVVTLSCPVHHDRLLWSWTSSAPVYSSNTLIQVNGKLMNTAPNLNAIKESEE